LVFLYSRHLPAVVAAITLLSFAEAPVEAQSGDHVVPLSDLRRDVNTAASQRAKNLADIDQVLSTPAAREQLRKANVGSERIKAAVSRLDDAELARLADQARAADQDVRAGGKGEYLFIAGLALTILLIVTLTQVL
jgi:hypothetical protein